MSMKEIFTRIDELIKFCNQITLSHEYQKVIFEIDNLIISLVGKTNDIYKDFEQIYKANKLDTFERGQLLVGVLNGLKNHLRISTQNKKYQIFVSSTYLDLIEYRKFVSDEIAFKGHMTIGMEDFTACGEDLETYIKNEIDQSDYYILLIGQRYGSHLPGDENMSYTMMEYYYAKSKNMRIIPFIYNGSEPLQNNDLGLNKDKLDSFISQVQNTVPQYFKDKNELIKKLNRSLDNEFKNHPQKGWIRL